MNEISPKLGYSIEYLEEAIRQNNDLLSMYNLSHIYIYEYFAKEGIDKSIELLIKIAKEEEFSPSYNLLSIALIKKQGFNIKKIEDELQMKTESNNIYFYRYH